MSKDYMNIHYIFLPKGFSSEIGIKIRRGYYKIFGFFFDRGYFLVPYGITNKILKQLHNKHLLNKDNTKLVTICVEYIWIIKSYQNGRTVFKRLRGKISHEKLIKEFKKEFGECISKLNPKIKREIEKMIEKVKTK